MEEKQTLLKLAALLKARYRKHSTIERLLYPDDPLPIEKYYLDLAIIKEQTYKFQRDDIKPKKTAKDEDNLARTVKMSRDYILHDYERIQYSQHKLTPEQLFTECQVTPKRIYIEGAAGAGKSTLSQFIAYQWGNDHPAWKHYDFLFRIRLRDLTTSKYSGDDEIDFIKFLENECFESGYDDSLTENEKSKLACYLKSEDKKVLFILDGHDELSLENNKIRKLWKYITHSKWDYILTSRPGVRKSHLDSKLNVALLGFNDEQIEKYINYFFDPEHTPNVEIEDANLCIQTFRQNINLWSLAHIPIQLELLCSMWGEELQQTSDITLTRIYTLMLEQLLKRHEQKRMKKEEDKDVILRDIDINPLLESNAVCFEFLENLAFQGMKRKDLVMPHKIIDDVYKGLTIKPKDTPAFFVKLRDLGLITRDSNGDQIEFIHLTFQEYFAAQYIARSFTKIQEKQKADVTENELKIFFRTTKWVNYYEVMYWFTAGLLAERNLPLSTKADKYLNRQQAFFDWLLEELQPKFTAKELMLLVRCLEEAELPPIKQRDKLIKIFTQWYEFYWRNEDKYLLRETELYRLEDILKQSPKVAKDYGTVKILTQALKDENYKIRSQAAVKLGELNIKTSEIIQGLSDLLESDDFTQFNAAGALVKLNEKPFEVMETLLDLQSTAKEDGNFEFMIDIAELLSELLIKRINISSLANVTSLANILENIVDFILIYKYAKCIVEDLLDLDDTLDDDFIGTKAGIAMILGILNFEKFRSIIEFLTKIFENLLEANEYILGDFAKVVLDTLKNLNIYQTYELVLNKLLDLIDNVNDEIRENAIKAIKIYMVNSPLDIKNKLLDILKDNVNSDYSRKNVAEALVDLNIPIPEISQILIRLLENEDWDDIQNTIEVLLGSSLINSQIIDEISVLLDSENNKVKIRIVSALNILDRNLITPNIRKKLVDFLSNDEAYTKESKDSKAIEEIKEIKESAANSLNLLYIKDYSEDEIFILLKSLKNEKNDAFTRVIIARVLISLKQDRINSDVIEVLPFLLNTQTEIVQESAAEALKELNETVFIKNKIEDLLDFSKDENNSSIARITIAQILCHHEVITPQKNIEILLGLLIKNDKYIKETAAVALVELNLTTCNERVIKELFTFLNDDVNNTNIRIKVAKTLIKLKPNKFINEVVKVLQDMLKIRNNNLTDNIVKLLKKINPEVIQNAQQGFLILLKDNKDYVSLNAVKAITELNINNTEMISILELLLKDANHGIKTSALITLSKLNKLSLKIVVQEALILLENISILFSVKKSLTEMIFSMPDGLYSFIRQCIFDQPSYSTISKIIYNGNFIDTTFENKETIMEQNQTFLLLSAENTHQELLQITTGQLSPDTQQLFFERNLLPLKQVMQNVTEETTFQSMLLLSAATGWEEGLNYLLTFNGFPLYSGNQDKLSIIHLLAATNRLDLLSDEYADNFNFNQATKDGITPLHLAIHYGHTEAVDFLLNEKGVGLQSVRFYWDEEHYEVLTPFQIAIVKGHYHLVRQLLTHPQFIGEMNLANGGNILHLAIKSFQNLILDLLLSQPLFANITLIEQEDRAGMKPLALAASLGNQQAILSLRQKGAQLNAASTHYGQYTALHFAIEATQIETIKLLVKIGAKLDSECQDQIHKEKKKRTPKGLAEYRAKQDNPTKVKNLFVGIKNILDNAKQQQEINQFSQITIEKVTFKNLVFKGGGPKGLAYGGALEAFSQRVKGQSDYPFPGVERVAGTSAGAITAALIAIGCTPLQMKDILEKTKPIEFLEGHSLKILSENTPIFERISIISRKISELRDPFNLLHFIKSVYSETTLCKGDVFLNWIEQQIAKYTNIPHCTFGELRSLIEAQSPSQPKFKHLHVATIKLDRVPDIEVLSSENMAYDHYVISSAIRASMSLPFIFEPHPLQGKVKNANQDQPFIIDKIPHVDAGLIDNYPIREFDQAKYKYAGLHQFKPHQNPHYPVFNDETLGFYIKPETEVTLENEVEKITKLSLVNSIKKIYDNAEEIMAKHYQDNTANLRTIPIDNAGVSLYDFDLTPKMQEALYSSGKKAVESSPILQSKKAIQSKKTTFGSANPAQLFFNSVQTLPPAAPMNIEPSQNQSNTNVANK